MTQELTALNYTARKLQLTGELLEEMDYTKEIEDDELYGRIDEKILDSSKETLMSLAERKKLRMDIFCALRKLDVLEELLQDESVTEIMINGASDIFIERGGGLEKWDGRFDSAEKLENIIQQIVAKCNRIVNEASPIVDARLEDGSRVNVVLAPIALNGPILTIRRFPKEALTMEKLIGFGALPQEIAAQLERYVKAGYNIIISGGTGSGKTTFLNALSNFIPHTERIITIEDSAELQIQGIENLVRLETRNANSEGTNAVTMQDLIKSALRMRPDRIIVGEIRGKEA
ncbi:MAG: Flp pilus assembly complex ATPase component TadA, partial [Lachnospiraceae bacterium]|nr:Flp pilus assembly complex ATPase component TadA [Lachnospiraceae bacterium]